MKNPSFCEAFSVNAFLKGLKKALPKTFLLKRKLYQRNICTMKKRKPLLTIAGILLLLFVAVSVSTVVTEIATAESATATRTLPAEPVSAGEFFTVRIEAQGYDTFGKVIETLPEGFTYMTSTLDPRAVKIYEATNTVTFTLISETSFTYTVRTPDTEGTYTFNGILVDVSKNEYEVSGDAEIVIVEADEEVEPTATRTLPEELVLASEIFTVRIKASHYGYFGNIMESLPEGFVYEDSTLNPKSVEVEDNLVMYTLWGEPSFTYTVTAPDTEGTYTFSGILIDEEKNKYEISGDAEIVVKQATGQFDTGSPANPYPSIFGMHTGNITPSQTITVQKLYTYPCPGTGGHAETIELYENGTLIANGTWNGYKGDWHKIWLNSVAGTPYVTLLKNQVYCYTIHTGSYPGIIHETSFNATGGTITCTDFTNANGKRYEDWIPAIRLE